jgi:branched-chain amino acid transport system permease protein
MLAVRNLSISFGGTQALVDASLTVGSGQIAGLIGPNGSGKTTLFNCVSGYYRPAAGRIMLAEHDITRISPHRAAILGIGRTFQSPNLFIDMSLRDNLSLARASVRLRGNSLKALLRRGNDADLMRETDRLLEQLGLGEHAGAFPSELPVGLGKLGDLGRALATNPKLLLLDEPAVGLNDAERERLITLLRGLRGLTILIVDHNMSFVTSLCETMTVLAAGRVICSGSPAHVRADPAVIEAYLGDEQ